MADNPTSEAARCGAAFHGDDIAAALAERDNTPDLPRGGA